MSIKASIEERKTFLKEHSLKKKVFNEKVSEVRKESKKERKVERERANERNNEKDFYQKCNEVLQNIDK